MTTLDPGSIVNSVGIGSLSGGDLTLSSTGFSFCASTTSKTTGKHTFQVTVSSPTTAAIGAVLFNDQVPPDHIIALTWNSGLPAWVLGNNDNSVVLTGAGSPTPDGSYVVTVDLDLDAQTASVRIDGTNVFTDEDISAFGITEIRAGVGASDASAIGFTQTSTIAFSGLTYAPQSGHSTWDAGGGGGLSPSLFTDADAFFSPSVVGSRVASPPLFTDTDSFFSPTVVRQPIFGELLGTLRVNANSITSSFSATGSVAVSVGDLIASVVCQQTNLTVTGVTDNLGNTYTAQNAGTDAGNVTGRLFYSIATVAGTLTSVTAACTGSTNDGVHIAAVIKGPFQSIDANAANITSDVTSPFTCPSTGTLAQASEVVIAWAVASHSTAWSATSPNLEAVERANSTTIKAIIGYQTVSSTSAVAPAFTAGSNPGQAVLGTLSFRQNLTQALTASLFSDTDTFFSPTVTQGTGAQNLSAPLYTDTDAFFSPTVTPGTAPLTAALYTDTDSFFSPTVTRGVVGLTAPLFTDTDSFFSPTVTISQNLAPALFSDTDVFFQPTVTPGGVTLTAGLFVDTDVFPSPTVTSTYALTAALFTDTDEFYQPTVFTSQSLVPALFSDDDTFYQPTVTVGAVTLSPSPYTDTDTFFTAVVSSGTLFLAPELHVDNEAFFSPTVSPGAVPLTAALYVDNEAFFSPSVAPGAVALTAGLFADTDSFFQPTVTTSKTIEPALFTDTDVFFAPTVAASTTLTPDLFVDTDAFYTHQVLQDQIQAPLYTDTDVFFSPTVTPGAVTIFPPHFVDVDTIQSHYIQHGQIGGGTSAAKGNRGLEKVRKKWPLRAEPETPKIPLPPFKVAQPRPQAPQAPAAVVDRRLIPDLIAMKREAEEAMDAQDLQDIEEILALLD